MKTFVFDNNYKCLDGPGIASWYFLADSSLTNAGKPFFIPNFAEEFEAIPVIAVRINRLGKSVAVRFSHRYFAEYAPAIHFRAPALLHQLRAMHLPGDKACSFDRSLIMADFIPFPEDSAPELTLMIDGEERRRFQPELMTLPLERVIEEASASNTLKMGDLIIPALAEGVKIKIGDLAQLQTREKTILSVQIK